MVLSGIILYRAFESDLIENQSARIPERTNHQNLHYRYQTYSSRQFSHDIIFIQTSECLSDGQYSGANQLNWSLAWSGRSLFVADVRSIILCCRIDCLGNYLRHKNISKPLDGTLENYGPHENAEDLIIPFLIVEFHY